LSLPFTDQHEYNVVAAVRSPRFVIGSTQSLSNIRKQKLAEQIGEETMSSSSTTPTAFEGSESSELSESSESRESAPSVSPSESFFSSTPPVTIMENQEQLVPLPVEQYLIPPGPLSNILSMPSMAHRKRSYEVMSLAAREEIAARKEDAAGKENDEMDDTIPINATKKMFEETKNVANDIEVIRPKSKEQNKEVQTIRSDIPHVDEVQIVNITASDKDEIQRVHISESREFIFKLPYGFARFWAIFLIVIVIIEMIFIYQFLFKSDEHFSKQALRFFASPMQTILNLVFHSQSLSLVLHIAAVPLDIYMGVVLFSLDPKRIDIKRVRKLYLRYIL